MGQQETQEHDETQQIESTDFAFIHRNSFLLNNIRIISIQHLIVVYHRGVKMLYINGTDPLYIQLCNQLRTDIENGRLEKGQKLLSERRLAAEYGISRLTARMALQCLQDRVMSLIEPQIGAYVL